MFLLLIEMMAKKKNLEKKVVVNQNFPLLAEGLLNYLADDMFGSFTN